MLTKNICVGVMLLVLVPASHVAYGQAAPKRLSDWLLEQPPSVNAYPLGLSWRVPDEVPAQNALRLELLRQLASAREVRADTAAVARLRDFIIGLPVTGRVPVAVADARWLQANPRRNPILLEGHRVVLPQRPDTVTVITGRGELCAVRHQSGVEAGGYVKACGVDSADWAWIAQPDGRVQHFGIAIWNREVQDELAPGAWIWAPARGSGWPEAFSQNFISFLATQGPAPDPQAATVACVAGVQIDTGREAPAESTGSSATGFGFIDPVVSADVGSARCADTARDASAAAASQIPAPPVVTRSRSLEVTASDWGNVGLLQTPTARMHSAGHFSFNASRVQPYTNLNIFLQPFDWFEVGFRYTDINNRPYGPQSLSGDQTYKDKSVDVKFRLWRESAYVPEIAVGLRDVGGTGLFSSEFVVANKRTGAFDWSLGLGWGYIGGRGNMGNPFSTFSSAFDTRSVNTGQGGTLQTGTYFRGPTSLFGGVQYQTPWEPLTLKLEYDGNNYQHEPLSNNQKQSTPVNVGLVYHATRLADVSLGVERGNTVMLGLALHTQLNAMSTPKIDDPPRVGVAPGRPVKAPDWSMTAKELVRQTAWPVGSIEQSKRELRVTFENADAVYWRERVERAAAVLHRDAPASVDRFTFVYRKDGMDVAEHVIDRDTWVTQQTRTLPPSEQRNPIVARAPEAAEPGEVVAKGKLPRFETGFSPGFNYSLGGPDTFALYQIYVQEQAKLRLSDDAWIEGAVRLRVVDNFDKFTYIAPSDLPRVRTYIRNYVTTSRVTLPFLQLTRVGQLTENQYYSAYGGYLEEMFAGVGGEWMYRPFASRIAFGIDANEVQQRDFQQNFGFGNAGTQTAYHVATGHATLYWDTGWQDVQTRLSAGRYLAGDIGATVELSRVFKNGVAIGAWATKTNVTAQQFGEGSFDKGIYIRIPFDAMLTKTSGGVGYFVWQPLIRDGGAKLARRNGLYGITTARSERTLQTEPAPLPNEALMPEDRRETFQPQMAKPVTYTHVTPRPDAVQWKPGTTYEFRLIEALNRQEFRNVEVDYDRYRLTVTLANDTILPISRAVGRAARTALNLAPLETREIRIRFAQRNDPAVVYDFIDLARLERYFNGALQQSELADYVAVEYINPAAREPNPLAQLDDLQPGGETPVFTQLVPETFSFGRVGRDVSSAVRTARETNWLTAGAIGAGIVLLSSTLDRTADTFAQNHAQNRWLTHMTDVGDAIPWLALAGSAVAAIDNSNPVRSRTAYAALEAGGASLLVVEGLKYATGRARPTEEVGNHSFKPFSATNGYDSFPSGHTIVSWAVATPFAKEYDAPWLYGVAAITNLGRVASRKHWVSDTVAGSFLGYGIGSVFWESARNPRTGDARVSVGPSGVRVGWNY